MASSTAQQRRVILSALASGQARTRGDLVRLLEVAPSTVSARVSELLNQGVVTESGETASLGGRRATILSLTSATGCLVVAEIGGHHARLGLFDATGQLLRTGELPLLTTDGPEATMPQLAGALRSLAAEGDDSTQIIGVALSLPGPVNPLSGELDMPARMPGWPGFDIPQWLEQEFECPAVVGNDANFCALGEHYAQFGPGEHSITVKAGTGIGAGIIVEGAIHYGATGAAGDLTHTRLPAAGDLPCSCGNLGCLETVASGAGLVRALKYQGLPVESTADILSMVSAADPSATTMLRQAGTHLGDVLAGIVNFVNPHALFLTGAMAASELFIAAVRSQIYEGCHPLATRSLTIRAASLGANAGLHGAARALVTRLFSVSDPAPEPM
ncbi:ROK family protein [Arthrobacter sp. 179]|uniref:ROK family protein n=1 Tax=Arthrobacter sp. 179 TaxID=3457734 RepID=UPI004034C384